MFNIYTKGALIQDEDVWTKIRKPLFELTYKSAKSGRAKLKIAPHDCGICHGADIQEAYVSSQHSLNGRDHWV